MKDADLVIEAVPERLEIKESIFTTLDGIVREDCVLATNTSSLSVTEMAEDLAHPERVVGLHFFNPVPVLPLVEVISSLSTSEAAAARAAERRANLNGRFRARPGRARPGRSMPRRPPAAVTSSSGILTSRRSRPWATSPMTRGQALT